MSERITVKDTTYQGWANRQTWGVALWIDNKEPLYRQRRSMTQDAWDDNENEDDREEQSEAARIQLGNALADWVEGMAPDLGGTLYGDLLTWALSSVDWDELADSWLNEEINEGDGVGGYVTR